MRVYAEVSLPPPIARELTYFVPDDLLEVVQIGVLAVVPVARQLHTGVVVGLGGHPDVLDPARIRPVAQLLDSEPLLDAKLIELCRWMSAYYFAPLGSALAAALPPGVQLTSRRRVEMVDTEPSDGPDRQFDRQILVELRGRSGLEVSTLRKRLGKDGLESALVRLKRDGYIEIRPVIKTPAVRPLSEQRVRLTTGVNATHVACALTRRAPRQAACVKLLAAGALAKKELVKRGFTYATVRGLEERGVVETFVGEVFRDPLAHIDPAEDETLQPTVDQQQIIATICNALTGQRFYAALLHGVTGSGKTLVYIQATARALEMGKGVVILVPEIALAWQMVRRFKARFGDQVGVVHSQLSGGERYDTWRRLRRGDQRIVIGARSAVMAPVPNLGLVVVDEEHDTSYKQEDLEGSHPLMYNARDLALVRARSLDAVVLLGSATPSLESYHNACSGKYSLLRLPRRIDDRPLPTVAVVDMRQEPYQRKERAIFSRALRTKIHQRLKKGEQIVLLQNRRGFAPCVACTGCGEAVACDTCRIPLTYHRQPVAQLRCHYCENSCLLPEVCQGCHSAELRFEGVGTQRIEEALQEQFSGIRVIRMDVDTTGWKGAHDQLVEEFRRGGADVLLGTQMVAKGLDFPQVTLVGVISADTGMHLPDFRASERCFQLLTQVAGRSGRGRLAGEVVVQTLLPQDPVLLNAAKQDYEGFVRDELAERCASGFPPFGRLVVFRWRGCREDEVIAAARKGTSCLIERAGNRGNVLGPAPAPLAQLNGHYRWQALLSGVSASELHALTAEVAPNLKSYARRSAVALTVNVDPITMM